MVRLRGSTSALGLDAICLGSVTALGVGRVWAAMVSARTVLINMTIANEIEMRMGLAFGASGEEKVYQNAQCSKAARLRPWLRFSILVHVDRAPGLVGGVAEVFERTVDTLGLARDAELASVPYDLVGKKNPLLARDDAHQVLLDLLRVIVRGQLQAARDAVDMSIDDHAFSFLEPRAQHDVGRLACDAWKSEKLFHVIGYLAFIVGDDLFRGADDRLRLVAEKAGGTDVGLELLGSELRQRLAPSDIFGTAPGVTRLTLASVD